MFLTLFAKPAKKEIEAERAFKIPVINGVIDDELWESIIPAGEFIQMTPFNGKLSTYDTEVRIAYDDNALYIAANLYDASPDSIVTILSKRDELGLSDYFGVYLDPFNDGLNAFGFFVTAAGVQVDMRSTAGGREEIDESWDAVWESAVAIDENGWNVEMRIPYSALRFPKESTSNWGMNLFRNLRRYREYSSWNFVDRKERSVNSQAGMLKGVVNVEPPLRLAFTPYAASYLNKYSESSEMGYSIKGGLDLKYGLNESYTLDMMLIPDFGQVQSDDEILNLTPFETYYDEKRSFFTEGNELFTRANIFYSRRIGDRPDGFSSVADELGENEKIIRNPKEAQILNATKISGKSSSGIGLGFLNGITGGMYAEIKDSISGETRKIKTQSLRNYNVSVIEKSLKNNSYISLINTNVSSAGSIYGANVTGTEVKISDKENKYAIFGVAALSSRKSEEGNKSTGANYDIDVSKTSGQFQWTLTQQLDTDDFNPNDLGYRRTNNQFSNRVRLSYNIYDPFWKFLSVYNSFSFEYANQYKPFEFMEMNASLRTRLIFINYFSLGGMLYYRPESFDWYEPRVDGRKFREPSMLYSNFDISSDYRKRFAIDAEITTRKSYGYDSRFLGIELSPRLRFNDKFFLLYSMEDQRYKNSLGYIANNSAEDSIYFGARNLNTFVNTLNANYCFNNKTNLSFRVRHYWSFVSYNNYFLLDEDGRLDPIQNYSAPDRNFNAFNVDMVYSWVFAPGSEISVVWKNAVEADKDIITSEYTENFRNTLNSPHFNSISFKILYYLDYHYMKKKVINKS
jgi:hypothetical protein